MCFRSVSLGGRRVFVKSSPLIVMKGAWQLTHLPVLGTSGASREVDKPS